MFLQKIKKLSFSLLTLTLLAWACGSSEPKEIQDAEETTAIKNNEYVAEGEPVWEKKQLERDALKRKYYYTYLYINESGKSIEKISGNDTTSRKKKTSLSDDLDVDDKNDLPIAKVVKREAETSRSINTPRKLDEKEAYVTMKSQDKLPQTTTAADIINDTNFNRPPIFKQTCLTSEDPESCSNDAVQVWIKENIDYPRAAMKHGQDGWEYVTFIIDKKGEVSDDVKVKSKDNPCIGCTQEALRVVSEFPKWEPALQNGHPVSVEVTLPIRFEYID